MTGPDSEKWLEAMRSEMESMYTNQVWTLVDPPEGVKSIGCKWVFKKKTDMEVKEFGFIKNEDESCVYKKVSGSAVIFLVLYVDDILLIENDIHSLQSMKTWLGMYFSMKDLCEATYVLGERHWIAVNNILKYLRRTKEMFLVYGGEEELVVRGYTNASFQSNKDDSRSQSGYVFSLNGSAVSWKSSKHEPVADSTTEAKYIATFNTAKEAIWIKKFVTELAVVPSIADPMELYCDNNGAIAQAKEPRSH
ncbi:hypothetical protein CRG98_029503 [Punica granatum]|uniref:Reverse transcriptase Ty1/copia-type domain-containing protein n=1 Tax=Punica granatum TaxID=22663 RepID=A0A2I0J1I7_PUNGR|nr:hypothetical protein CRG98_029503 [Punica granatum]